MRILGSLDIGVQVCKRLDNTWPVPRRLNWVWDFPRRFSWLCLNDVYTQRCTSHSEKKANMYFVKRTTDFWVVIGRWKHESLCDWHWLRDLTFGWAILLISCIPVLLWPHCLESTSGLASSLDALQEKHCVGTVWCMAHSCKGHRVPIETACVGSNPSICVAVPNKAWCWIWLWFSVLFVLIILKRKRKRKNVKLWVRRWGDRNWRGKHEQIYCLQKFSIKKFKRLNGFFLQ